jgi:hypothetical protein
MKKYIICLLVLICFSCEDSSIYSGYVYNEKNKSLPDVKVQIVGSDIFTMTDENGFFSIDHKNRGDELLVIKEGYAMQFYTPESSSEDIELILIEESK